MGVPYIFYAAAFVFGSLVTSAFTSDWRIPRRPYHIALAVVLLAGIIVDICRMYPS